MREGKLVQLTVCEREAERTTLLVFLDAYGIYATSPDQLAHGVSRSPSCFGGYPIFVVDKDREDALALIADIRG